MSDVPDREDVQLVDAAVFIINQAVAEKVFTGSLEIGAYLLKTFFNNDIELAATNFPAWPPSVALPRDIRRSLQKTASAFLVQAPNIVRLYENLLRNLEEITVELEEL